MQVASVILQPLLFDVSLVVQGRWSHDELVFAADIETSEGRVTRGNISCGLVKEFDHDRLVFAGSYKDSLRHGKGTIYHLGGGQSDAVFQRGSLTRYLQYRYPCRFGTSIDGRSAAPVGVAFTHSRLLSHAAAGVCARTCPAMSSSAAGRCCLTRTSRSECMLLRHPARARGSSPESRL
jgi:hypothetical protein